MRADQERDKVRHEEETDGERTQDVGDEEEEAPVEAGPGNRQTDQLVNIMKKI